MKEEDIALLVVSALLLLASWAYYAEFIQPFRRHARFFENLAKQFNGTFKSSKGWVRSDPGPSCTLDYKGVTLEIIYWQPNRNHAMGFARLPGHVTITAKLRHPLPFKLSCTTHRFFLKDDLWRIFRGPDLLLGDAEFDRRYDVLSDPESLVLEILDGPLRERLVSHRRYMNRVSADNQEVKIQTLWPYKKLEQYVELLDTFVLLYKNLNKRSLIGVVRAHAD